MWAFTLSIYRDLPTYHHWQLQTSSEQHVGQWNHDLFDQFHSVLSWRWWADAHDGVERGCGCVWCASVYACVMCVMGRWWWVIVKELNNVSGGWSFKSVLNYMHTVDAFYMHIWQWPCGSDGSDNENPRRVKDPPPALNITHYMCSEELTSTATHDIHHRPLAGSSNFV